MSVTDYDGLKSELAAYAKRSDLTANVDTFIDLSEAYFNRKLKLQDMESTTTLSTIATTSTVSLPDDFLQVKTLVFTDNPKRIDFITQDKLTGIYAGNSTGRPVAAARYPDNKLLLGPTPDGVYTLSLSYYKKIPALSASTTSNWLLEKSPDLYLYKGLSELAKFIENDDDAVRYENYAEKIISELKAENNETRFPSQGMSMRAEVVI